MYLLLIFPLLPSRGADVMHAIKSRVINSKDLNSIFLKGAAKNRQLKRGLKYGLGGTPNPCVTACNLYNSGRSYDKNK